jgi:predicted nucleic acid-binding protein
VPASLLIDTGAFIALLDADDALHSEAARFEKSLPPTIQRATTQAVVGECYTFLRYRHGAGMAAHWLDYLDEARATGHLLVLYTDDEEGCEAEKILRSYRDQDLSYTDALTLSIAQRNDVGAIFGFDHHLALTGVPLLPGSRRTRR